MAQVEKLLSERGVNGTEAAVLARISEGSVGGALNLREQEALEYRQTALAFLEALPLAMPMNYVAGRAWIEKYELEEALLFVKLLQLLLRDMLLVKTGITAELYNCDLQENLQTISVGWQVQGLKQALLATNDAYKALVSSAGRKLVLEALVMKIDKSRKE